MLSRLPRAYPTAYRRSFVSTVLLARTWDNVTVVELRKEAKARGLSTKGNKSTLIARIQQHEHSVTQPIRTSSSQKTAQAASPGIPLAPQTESPSRNPLAIKLPISSQPLPDAPVQVPYVPDFWNSAPPKVVALVEQERPKLHVVGGSATHYDGGPTHNLEKHREVAPLSSPVETHVPSVSTDVSGFWPDLWESLGLPRSLSIRRALSEANNLAAMDESQTRSRPLTDQERKGLYVLLGIIGGSWLIGGCVNRPASVAEKYGAQSQH